MAIVTHHLNVFPLSGRSAAPRFAKGAATSLAMGVLAVCATWAQISCAPADDAGSPSSSVILAAVQRWEAAQQSLTDTERAAVEAELTRMEGLAPKPLENKLPVPADIQETADLTIPTYALLARFPGTEDGDGDEEHYAFISPKYVEKLRRLEADLDAAFEFQSDAVPAVKAKAIRARTTALSDDYDALIRMKYVDELLVAERAKDTEDLTVRFDRLCDESARAFEQSSASERLVRAEARREVEQARADLLVSETELEVLLLRVSPSVARDLLASGAVPTPAAAAAGLADLEAELSGPLNQVSSGEEWSVEEIAAAAEVCAGLRAAQRVWELERAAVDKERAACGTVECEVLIEVAPTVTPVVAEEIEEPIEEEEGRADRALIESSGLTGEKRRLLVERLQRESASPLLSRAKEQYIETRRRILGSLASNEMQPVTRSVATPRGRLLQQDLQSLENVRHWLAESEAPCSASAIAAAKEIGQLQRAQVERRAKAFQVRMAAILQASARSAE